MVAERDLLCVCIGEFISEEQILTASQRRRIYDHDLVSICHAMCQIKKGGNLHLAPATAASSPADP